MFIKGFILLIMYILGGSLLEHYFNFTSPALFSFYGYVMAVLTSAVLAHHEFTNK